MSEFVRNLNLIKRQFNITWLSPSQAAALDLLFKATRYPGTVNLWGSVGVGKTFLCWIMARETGMAYIPHISFLDELDTVPTNGVIVDNCLSDRSFHRTTLNKLAIAHIQRVVLVSRPLIQDYTNHVELLCTGDDMAHVYSILCSVGVFSSKTSFPNLWHMINPYGA